MKENFCITARFVQPFPVFHGLDNHGENEWPIHPLRLFQAIVNASRDKLSNEEVLRTIKTLESLDPPIIIAPYASLGSSYKKYVPLNQDDVKPKRIEKIYFPLKISKNSDNFPELHYIYSTDDNSSTFIDNLQSIVRSVTHLGWGIDQVVVDARKVDEKEKINGEKWVPSKRGKHMRVPCKGTFESLEKRQIEFVNRLKDGQPDSVKKVFNSVCYRSELDKTQPPYVVFDIIDKSDKHLPYPQNVFIHLSGMTRHLIKNRMEQNPPLNFSNDNEKRKWISSYIEGHDESNKNPPHLSYIPIPSIGHRHTDPSVRRIMIVAPVGDDEILKYIVEQIDGRSLNPELNSHFRSEPILSKSKTSNVENFYIESSDQWATFFPMILPGEGRSHTRIMRSIKSSLREIGINSELLKEVEYSSYSVFPKSLSAHKKDHNGMPIYLRPDHLLNRYAVHLKLKFKRRIPGPIIIGAGKHYGFGLMAGI